MKLSLPLEAAVQQSTLEQPEANASLTSDTCSPEKLSFRGKRLLTSVYTLRKRSSLLRELRQNIPSC